jgi:putative ABC transport system permease protein
MIRNFFKTAFRNLARNKTYTIINISGLAIGMAVCITIFLLVQFELSFDAFHQKKNRIYRVITQTHNAEGAALHGAVPFPLPKTLRTDFPQLQKVTAVYGSNNDQIAVLDEGGKLVKKFKEESGVFFTEPEFFGIMDFKWIAGSPASLSEPNRAALTKATAEKYFGDWKLAMGKTIRRNSTRDLLITGILEDVPDNTDFQLRIVGSFITLNIATSTDWISINSSMACYVLLPENLSPKTFEALLVPFVKKYKPADAAQNLQLLQPLSEVHYDAETGNFLQRTISKQLISALIFIAGFILLIACVNFINLSTAQAVNRGKEVGIRKVLGSGRAQLRLQFLSETALIVVAAIMVSVLVSAAFLPLVRNVLDLPIHSDLFSNPQLILFLVLLVPIVVLLAGFYPSIVLSRFNPISSLKSRVVAGSTRGISLRKTLVVLQFVIAQALIIGTVVIVQQMNYFTGKSMGFDKEAILNVPIPSDSASLTKLDYLKTRLSGLGSVQRVSFSFASPADNGNWFSPLRFGHSQKDSDFPVNLKWADHDYIPAYNLQLIAGRNIKRTDTVAEFVVNESLIRKFGYTDAQQALNKEIDLWDGFYRGPVVGVIKDFHSAALQDEITPVVIASNRDNYNMATIKLKPGKLQHSIIGIEQLWNQAFPDYVFEYQFLDQKIAGFYTQEQQLSQLYRLFAIIAIFLSCLGLYGLASFMAAQRIKEVGIRKVLGASVQHVVFLFSKEFILLICIAFVIAAPVAYYYMNNWLQDFAYRIDIEWWVFALAAAISLLIALLTVSSQAIRAAISNPVNNLRTE